MALINVFLLFALSSLFSSADAICVPRNASQFDPPLASLVPPNTTPPQAPPQATPQAPKQKEATDEEAASVDSGMEEVEKMHNDMMKSMTTTVKTELTEICDVTSNPQLCATSISSNMDGQKLDPTTALKTEIEESIKEVKKAIATLKSLNKDTTATKVEKACFDTCLEVFDMAVEDLKSGIESIDVKDTGKMESVLTAVMTDLTTCDDTFEEMGVDSPLDNLSAKMEKYASNCLAISKLLM